jgi:hypothetical protein
MTNSRQAVRAILLLLLAGILVLAQATVNLSLSTYLLRELANFSHTIVFGLLSLALLKAAGHLPGLQNRQRPWHYLFAAAVAFGLGLVTEIIQISSPRDADLWDQVRNTAGIVAFLGLALARDRQMNRPVLPGRWWRRLLSACSIAILLASIVPTLLWAEAYRYRDRHAPMITGFESIHERRFIRPDASRVEFVAVPEAWPDNRSRRVARLTMIPPEEWPGLKLVDPFPDWRGYEFFSFEVYFPHDTVVGLTVRIDDDHHNQLYEDRFTRTYPVSAGVSKIDIPLQEIRITPSGRPMDMRRIAGVIVCVYHPTDTLQLYLDDFRLR